MDFVAEPPGNPNQFWYRDVVLIGDEQEPTWFHGSTTYLNPSGQSLGGSVGVKPPVSFQPA